MTVLFALFLTIAENLIKKNMSAKEIQDITGISNNSLEEIAKKIGVSLVL